MAKQPVHAEVYKCPGCGSAVPASRLDPPEGVPSCDECHLRLGRRGNTVTVLAQVVSEDLPPEETDQLLRHELDGGLVVSRLRDMGGKAFEDRKVCETIRRTEGYADMLEVVAKHAKKLPQKKILAIADALQGAYLLDESTLTEGKPIGGWLTPAELRAAVRWAKHEHPKFVRRSKRFLQALDDYRRFVQGFKALESGPNSILAAISNLGKVIRSAMDQSPRHHGTPLRDFHRSPPHILAAIRIVSVLKGPPKPRATHTMTIELCVAMLRDAGLTARRQDPEAEAKLLQSISKAIQRSHLRASQ